MRWLIAALYSTPYSRTVGVVINSIIGGILTNWLIADLSVGGHGVEWSKLRDTTASWWLGGFLVVFALYTYGLIVYERQLSRWNDPSFLQAKLNETLVPIFLERMAERVRKGEAVSLAALRKELLGE